MKIFKKISSVVLKTAVSIALLAFLFKKTDTQAVWAVVKNADKYFLGAAFLVYFINFILGFLRWEMLLRTVGIKLPFKRVIISLAGGNFFNLFLPSTIGGDFMRTTDLALHTKKAKEVIATVFLDRLSGYIGLVILAIIALAFGWKYTQDKSIIAFLAVISAILTAVLLILFNKTLYMKLNRFFHNPARAHKITELVKNLHHEIHLFRNHKKVIFLNLLLSIAIQSIIPLSFYLIALSLGIQLRMVYFFIFLPIIGVVTLLPVSIGGLGLRDATTILLFAKAGLSKDLSFAMSLLGFFIILVYGLISGIIYAITLHYRRLQPAE